jgi:hypothetical protein
LWCHRTADVGQGFSPAVPLMWGRASALLTGALQQA